VVIGAGIAGLTTALLLKRAGARVAVVEGGRVARGVSGSTTAKVTAGHTMAYTSVEGSFGAAGAAAYAASHQEAVETVAALTGELGVDCQFTRLSHYVYSVDGGQREALAAEAAAAARAGLAATAVDAVPLPYATAGAVRFDGQAQFHPRRYLLALAAAIPGDGCHLFEDSRVLDIREGTPCIVRSANRTVRGRDVVVTTHQPFVDRGNLYAKVAPKRSYVLTAPIAPDAAPEGTFISTEQPGEVREPERFQRLEAWMRERFPVGETVHRWSVQDAYSADRVPFIGRLQAGDGHVLVATGFSGWGMTGGTVAGRILSDAVTGTHNPHAWLYDPNRRPHGTGQLLRQNARVAGRYVAGAIPRRRRASAAHLAPGEATVLQAPGGKVAAYRDESGVLHAVSATCTHLGCTVAWNGAERTWDCPCHGSRFGHRGEVLQAPAVSPLADRSWAVEDAEDGDGARPDTTGADRPSAEAARSA
jgi:glycine/D-amino acid oxidase-like deaminating enzyme/nitrite reductase/ring-hydroxylating ferredoxin subunit